jgi:SagB-type dehydrogenase family enzyme
LTERRFLKNHEAADDTFTTAEAAAVGAAFNGYETVALAQWATGILTESRRQRTLGAEFDASLAEDYLANVGVTATCADAQLSAELYFSPPAYAALSLHGTRAPDLANRVSLPKSLPLRFSLDQSIQRRRSSRVFTGDSMPLEMMATLIRAAASITGDVAVPIESSRQHVKLRLRASPSAGGLYPIDLWLLVQNIKNLPPGIYSYSAAGDLLERRFDADAVKEALRHFQIDRTALTIDRACVTILFVAFPARTLSKYGNRGLKFLFQEVGAMAQNINLAAAALGVGAVECGGFAEKELRRLLGLRQLLGHVVHSQVVGIKG